jgi:crossover junction endodeoxyribonuclease RusA
MFLLLPAPPSLNDYYVVQPRGKFHAKVVSKVGKIYQDTIALFKRKLNIPTFRGDLAITLDCFPYSRNSRDIDNYYKCLLDSMQYAGILDNDNNIKWELGRMQQPFRVDNWYYGNSMIILEIKPLKFKPISLAEKIVQILDDGNQVVGLTSAPQEVINSIKSEKNKLFK